MGTFFATPRFNPFLRLSQRDADHEDPCFSIERLVVCLRLQFLHTWTGIAVASIATSANRHVPFAMVAEEQTVALRLLHCLAILTALRAVRRTLRRSWVETGGLSWLLSPTAVLLHPW